MIGAIFWFAAGFIVAMAIFERPVLREWVRSASTAFRRWWQNFTNKR